ncbi:DUF805 domain-containing protein [Xanthomarina sp. F2636L]|uniref:DUF805 domain-containing protein n=1 Tax=Xanthomarina sp. F2636L TaxID=2996018 RepID=UPI00225E0A12|nr:DUF805 domain-containing protein [Xanthomarina sp. F2636L]MCX7549610.1 DUF805 domain-containing protein [Xanthomarina sp. F2636L]
MNWYLKVLKEHYADFNGRARRKEYWMFVLVNLIISWSLALLDYAVGSGIFSIISTIYSLVIFVPSLAVAVRRLHDIGKSGWYYLLILLPIIGWIWLIVLFATDSQPGPNKWGNNPKEIGNDSLIDSIGTE